MNLRFGFSLGMLALAAAGNASETGVASPEAIFQQRILPIFKSPDPSSCTECHLSGVDLKNYLLPSAEKTFANLRDLKLIDLDAPEKSEILRFIAMTPESEGYEAPGAGRIDPALRKAELEAFAAWIIAGAKDPRFREAPHLNKEETAAPDLPADVIRHGRTDRLLTSYEKNIWSLRFRCAGCHMPGGEKFEKHAEKHGFEKMAWLKDRGPGESMRHLMASDLIDIENPEKSELILKPLDDAEEEHGGGVKMRRGDTDYIAFLNWIRDYANLVNGAYREAGDLPGGREMTGTEIWLQVTGLPESLTDKGVLLAVHSAEYPERLAAVSSTTVVHRPKLGVTMANGFLMRRDQLSPGKYIVSLYRSGGSEADDRSIVDWEKSVAEAELLYTGEVTAKWQPGYKNATVIERKALHGEE